MTQFHQPRERLRRQEGTGRAPAAPAPGPAEQPVAGNQAVQRQLQAGALPLGLIAGGRAALGNQAVQRLLTARGPATGLAIQREGADAGVAVPTKRKGGQAGTGADEVARQKLNEINPISIAVDEEYGGVIYRDDRSGAYSATGPRTSGEKHTVDVGLREPNKGCPAGTTPVAYYHTHGKLSDPLAGGLRFNDEDLIADDIEVAKQHEIDAYLATPSGRFLKYEYATGQTVQLSGTIATQIKEDKSIPVIRGGRGK